MAADLDEFIDQLALVDHHVHGAFRDDGAESRFQNSLNEGNSESLIDPSTGYNSQLAFALRRWCAPLLDLPVHVAAQDYWRRRSEIGEAEIARRMLTHAGVSEWLVDTGFRTDDFLSPAEMARLSGGSAREIVRVETVAEQLITTIGNPNDYADAFRNLLSERTVDAIGTKSVIAYRAGFDLDLSRPSDTEVATAAAHWCDEQSAGGTARLADPTLLRFGLHAAVDLGLPLQLHVGLGDRDLDLRAVNPLHLIEFLRAHEETGVPILLLHCYPYEREAGYLAQAFETVHMDVGLAVNHLGVQSIPLIARSLELAPFGKLLYASDAIGPAELHYLGAALWRRGMRETLGGWVDAGDWSAPDARRVVQMIGRDNARRVYRLG
ncbi:amidohydrolase family protein [Aldersonia kunmingensis]|uniref:amidohydrolase family protein n=1 Tax=Aldersonia kunmingensis TaxID=408066 RepID=UPI00082A6629|nr:amidohydrolase family protein [Aldersonia kunmingensis]